MADDLDVDNLLEAPYKQENDHGGYREETSGRDRDKKKSSRDKERRRSRSRDRHHHHHGSSSGGSNSTRGSRRHRSRSRSRDRRGRGGSRDRKSRRGGRSRSQERNSSSGGGGGGGGGSGGAVGASSGGLGGTGRRFGETETRARSPPMPRENLTPEERDARTVFCMQLAARLRPRDLEQFFSAVGKVRDVRIITDNKTRRSKGIAYIEFVDTDSVPLALGLNGQRLLGVPILVQPSQAEKNRIANSMSAAAAGSLLPITSKTGPMRLYVGSLHFNITEDMLRGIFEPFGKIDHINLVMDNETGRSKGFGFITFHGAEDAKKALEQLNGFELAGRPMKVGHVTERQGLEQGGSSVFDTDDMDRAGIDLGATGRLQLMAKLAEGTGFQIPTAAANALSIQPSHIVPTGIPTEVVAPPIATQCFMLSNMFDPQSESNPLWEVEIRDDVIEECNKHGGVLHIYVDKASPQGNVYVKCPTISAAVASVNSLHGRFFAGRVITAAYVPLPNYHQLFPDALRATQLLLPASKGGGGALAQMQMQPPHHPGMFAA